MKVWDRVCGFVFDLLLLVFLLGAGAPGLAKKRDQLPPKPTKNIQPILISRLQRLDPHGDRNLIIDNSLIEREHGCQLCHSVNEGSRATMPLDLDLCYGCHNRSPHSGVLDHRRHDVTCLDCHEVHRSRSLLTPKSNDRWHHFAGTPNSSEWVVHSKPNAMIKKDCKDCHH